MTLPITAGLSGESHPGEILDLLQEVAVLLNLLQTPALRILGRLEGANPVQVTANPARHKLQQTPGEAVALSLLTRSGWSVENFPLHEVKVPVHPSLYLEINALSLTQPGHVDPGPELTSLVQEDLVAVGQVLVVTALHVSWWKIGLVN